MGTVFIGLGLSLFAYFVYSLVSTNPAQIQYKKGMEYLSQNNFYDAEQFFLKAVDSDNLHTPSYLKLAEIYESQGLTDKALQYLGLALTSFANPFDKYAMKTLMRMGEIQYSLGKYQEAWHTFLLLHKMNHHTASLFFYLGELYMVQKRYGEAINFYDESLALDKNQPRVLFYKAISLVAMKEKKESIQTFKMLESDKEYGSQALYLMGKINYDLGHLLDASHNFGVLLNERNPLYLKDILLYKGYEILLKPQPSDEELTKAMQYFNRGGHLKDLPADFRKEFLFHLSGIYILKKQFNESKLVLKDLCRLDAYYKGADQLFKSVSKEMLIKEEHGPIIERYVKFQRDGHIKHEVSKGLRIEEFFPNHLPLLALEKLEENSARAFLKKIENLEFLSSKFNPTSPKTAMELSASSYDTFEAVAVKISSKLGIVVEKNMATAKYEAFFVGIDNSEQKTLVYFYKPSSIVGAIAMADVLDKRDSMEAKKVHYVNCGKFTEEATELARKNHVNIYDKSDLKKLL